MSKKTIRKICVQTEVGTINDMKLNAPQKIIVLQSLCSWFMTGTPLLANNHNIYRKKEQKMMFMVYDRHATFSKQSQYLQKERTKNYVHGL